MKTLYNVQVILPHVNPWSLAKARGMAARASTAPSTRSLVEKSQFKVFRMNDDRLIVENPFLIDVNGNDDAELLIIGTDGGLFIKGLILAVICFYSHAH